MVASNTAQLFDELFGTFTVLAVLVAVVVFGLMVYLVIRYRARPSDPEPQDTPQLGRMPEARGHRKTIVVSVTLSSIILGVLIFGTLSNSNLITTIPSECIPQPNLPGGPGNCLYIRVTAYRFGWNFTYPNGVTLSGNLTIPTDRIVVLRIFSVDVFHSFGIDAFKIKKDAIPGLLTNAIWFKAGEQGQHLIRCFELCGSGHAGMIGHESSVSQSHFAGFCSSSISGC